MDLALFALHLLVGLVLMAHGAQKLFGAFGGGGLDGTAATFEKLGLRPAWLHARFAGGAEFFGGLALALGLLLPFAAALIIAVMTAAILTVHLRNGFFVTASGYEYNLVLIGIAFALAGAGGGAWSLDAALGLDLTGAAWALGALAVGIAGGAGAVFTGRRYGARSERGGHTPHAHPA